MIDKSVQGGAWPKILEAIRELVAQSGQLGDGMDQLCTRNPEEWVDNYLEAAPKPLVDLVDGIPTMAGIA
jgi:hypothetical protein